MPGLLAGLALFFGEFIIIGVEMWAAKQFGNTQNHLHIFLTALGVSIVACVLLVYGYTYGYRAFKNIWVVTAISISGILVVEPIVAWLFFRELPTIGAGVAFGLAILGIILSLAWK